MKSIISRYYVIISLLTISTFASCVSLKKERAQYGDQNKSFVVKQKIKGNKALSSYDIKLHLKQDENSYFIVKKWNPQLHSYYVGKRQKYFIFRPYDVGRLKQKMSKIENKYDEKISKQEGNRKKTVKLEKKKEKKLNKKRDKIENGTWLSNSIGEKPEFLDTAKIEFSQKQIKLFLSSKGYFENEVSYEIKTKKNRSTITYFVTENRPHILDSINLLVQDTSLKEFVAPNFEKHSLLKEEQSFDIDKLTSERNRITNLLKNNGYYDFDRQSLYFNVDTSYGDHKVIVDVIVKSPEGKSAHTKYDVSSVTYIENSLHSRHPDSTTVDNIKFIYPRKNKIWTKTLNNQIKVRPNEAYNFQSAQLTQRLLSNLNTYKFVNINYQKVDSNKLACYINTSNMKKYGLVTEGGINVNINQGQGLPGPFVSASWLSRRFLRGYEYFEISGFFSFESQPNITDASQNYQTREYGVNASLIFPKLMFPFGLNKKLWRTIPSTKLTFGYNSVERVEYSRSSITGILNYSGIWSKDSRWSFSLLDISVINTNRISESFSQYLNDLREEGNNLYQSFNPAIVSSINFAYIFNNNSVTENKKARFFLFNIEFGGPLYTIARTLNHTWGDGSLNNEVFGLPFYEFFKSNFDVRKYLPVSKNSNINFRLNTGIAIPYGGSENLSLPYEKYYFAGGLNSIRAWEPRRLGPGSYSVRDNNGNVSYQYEQPGELITELSLEYRTKIIGFIHGAAFLDAGNVWMLTNDQARPGSTFGVQSFYKEIAVGTGLGLRLDFSFLVFRYDLGMKLYDPARNGGVPFNDPHKFIHNIGIGYPF